LTDSDEALLKYAAWTLGDLRRRYIQNGQHWPVELESLRLLASERQAAPFLDDTADSRLAVDYEEAARRLHVSRRTLQRLVASGELPTVVIGGCARVTVADLEAFVAGLDRRRERSA
jgi:excisionase family DNA binding protein